MTALSVAERILQDLGVSAPEEIDLEAIAWTMGARVKYRQLDGCEARIVGYRDRAIISIDPRAPRRRRRYSIGHELGHWKWHRGKALACQTVESAGVDPRAKSIEREADRFSADLLLPRYLFDPLVLKAGAPTLKNIHGLSEVFDTSKLATAIRFVSSRHCPAILVCHDKSARRWFIRSPMIPERWFPSKELHSDSSAFQMLFGQGSELQHPQKIGAEVWFDRSEAERFEIKEQCFQGLDDTVLTILTFVDERMLEER